MGGPWQQRREINSVGWGRKEGRKDFFFVNKKEAKKTLVLRAVAMVVPIPAGAKVFCFFFSKKKRLPLLFSHRQVVDAGFRRHDVARFGGQACKVMQD